MLDFVDSVKKSLFMLPETFTDLSNYTFIIPLIMLFALQCHMSFNILFIAFWALLSRVAFSGTRKQVTNNRYIFKTLAIIPFVIVFASNVINLFFVFKFSYLLTNIAWIVLYSVAFILV